MADISAIDALNLPDSIKAVVFDMDGVLLDTIGADLDLCVAAADDIVGSSDWLTRKAVLDNFALEPESFWTELIKAAPAPVTNAQHAELVARYNALRQSASFPIIPGAVSLLKGLRAAGYNTAAASSNDLPIVKSMLEKAGIATEFDVISGIVGDDIQPKPAPDIYLDAAKQLQIAPISCAFIEDSTTGLTAGTDAGYGYAVAVATGATKLDVLEESDQADIYFDRFDDQSLTFIDGAPMNKSIDTPNDFVSHMVEHIGWRVGAGVDLAWRNTNWRALGCFLGAKLLDLNLQRTSAATLGMIDDGAAETLIDFTREPGLDFDTHATLPRDKVLAMRAEQVSRGQELADMLEGLSEGLGAHITVRLCTFEDPHHSWEGVYRAIGICLGRLRVAA